jgi:hypothetical protein
VPVQFKIDLLLEHHRLLDSNVGHEATHSKFDSFPSKTNWHAIVIKSTTPIETSSLVSTVDSDPAVGVRASFPAFWWALSSYSVAKNI